MSTSNPTSVSSTTTVSKSYAFTGDQIIHALRSSGLIPDDMAQVDSITVRVPGGGDWSNTDLDLREEAAIVKTTNRWTKTG